MNMCFYNIKKPYTSPVPFIYFAGEGLGNSFSLMRMREIKQICSQFKFVLTVGIPKHRHVLPILYYYIYICIYLKLLRICNQ